MERHSEIASGAGVERHSEKTGAGNSLPIIPSTFNIRDKLLYKGLLFWPFSNIHIYLIWLLIRLKPGKYLFKNLIFDYY